MISLAKTLLLLSIAFLHVLALSNFKIYPLGDDYFQKIYLVNQNGQQYYLTIGCKQKDMLSISLTLTREFVEYPPFNIYGSLQAKPRMGKGAYTFLQECHAYVDISTNKFLQVKRRKDGQTIFALADLSLQNDHNQFTVYDQSTKWGLGQRFQKNFHVSDGKWTIWNRDKPWKIDNGVAGVSEQTYGHHPLYLAREKITKLHHLIYFKNTNGLQIESKNNSQALVYHSIGGHIHFIIIVGQLDPEPLLEKYHEYIGRGHIPPFWSFGHHQCRWGYQSFAAIRQVVAKYNQNDIPLDTFWSDLEYMDRKMIFTVNQGTHPAKEINALLLQQDLHFVPLLDVGVSTNDRQAMDMGKQLKVFFKSVHNSNQYYTGEVWPGEVHFVDYLHPNATTFWKSQMQRLHNRVNFSGIWLDMNEPSNFKGGQSIDDQPFRIQQNQNLNMMTINTKLLHYNQRDPTKQLRHRQVHAYYGHLSTVPTFEFLSKYGRPFIISRSTSVGSGHFVGHWTGDNVATWQFLRLSISGNFLFQIFGIQMVGADICGFNQDTTEQLCSRWYQVGAFYPFSRNHNVEKARSQQPYAFGSQLLETSKASLKTRYSLLKQLYTIYLQKRGKGSFYRPITFQFYDDEQAYEKEAVETQVLIGKFLMTTPIVYQGKQQRDVYFPGQGQKWYQFEIEQSTGKVDSSKIAVFQGKTKQNILNPLPSAAPTFLRAGYLLLTNYPERRSIKLNSDFHLFAALKDNQAIGSILSIDNYNDEDQIKKCISGSCLYSIHLTLSDNNAKITWKYTGSPQLAAPLKIKSLLIVGDSTKWKSSQQISLTKSEGTVSISVNKQ